MDLEKKFWKPSVTSQFFHCPVPFHMDTYRGCLYNCSYCFARDFVTFSRRNSEHKEFQYLVGNRADLLKNWIERTLKKEYDYNKAEEVAFKERIPLKIGATADPFPRNIEEKERVTYGALKVLHEYDYPVEIQTKNPEVLASYAEEFIGANWTIAVTLISTDEDFVRVCEPQAPTAKSRLDAIKKLTDLGFYVMVKIQPAIYPKILTDLPEMVKAIKEAGVWAFNIEGLKIRITMPESERKIMQTIGEYLDMDIREFYKNERQFGAKGSSDYELSPTKKEEFIFLADSLAKEYGLKFYNADNHLVKVGAGCECCGTEVLRDYKLLGCDSRSILFENEKGSKELEKCFVNFVRNNTHKGKTICEACSCKNGGYLK